jgi:hypothetical protein
MWNEKRYNEVKSKVEHDLKYKVKSPFDYMMEYKKMIVAEDYEAAKAITEVLKSLNYETSDTHEHIKELSLNAL